MCLSVFVSVSHGKTENFRHVTDWWTVKQRAARWIKIKIIDGLLQAHLNMNPDIKHLLSCEVVNLYWLPCCCGNSPFSKHRLLVEQLHELKHMDQINLNNFSSSHTSIEYVCETFRNNVFLTCRSCVVEQNQQLRQLEQLVQDSADDSSQAGLHIRRQLGEEVHHPNVS